VVRIVSYGTHVIRHTVQVFASERLAARERELEDRIEALEREKSQAEDKVVGPPQLTLIDFCHANLLS
jgi:hypothetical protein